jgi:protein phosphatase
MPSSLAGSWLEWEAHPMSASDSRGRDAAGEFHDTADNHLLVVADGRGEPDGGARAARTCVEILGDVFRGCAEPIDERLRRGVALANERLNREAGAESHRSGVATAALALGLAPEPRAWVFRVGGYRAYRLRAGQLIALGSSAHAPTRLGLDPSAGVEIQAVDFAPGDRFLICSEALSDAIPEEKIGAILRLSSPSAIAYVLAKQARKRGAHDDISVQVVVTYEPVELGASLRPHPDCAPEQVVAVEGEPEAPTRDPHPDSEAGGVAGFGPPRLEPVDLASIIDSELPGRRSAMRERSLVVLKEQDRDAPPALADERQIRFVIRTLLDVAMRTVPPGGDLYLGSLHRRGASGVPGTCRVLIRYRSPGSANTGAYDSSGAGPSAELAIARDLVEAMGGAFAIDAASGLSTAVSIDLPT